MDPQVVELLGHVPWESVPTWVTTSFIAAVAWRFLAKNNSNPLGRMEEHVGRMAEHTRQMAEDTSNLAVGTQYLVSREQRRERIEELRAVKEDP